MVFSLGGLADSLGRDPPSWGELRGRSAPLGTVGTLVGTLLVGTREGTLVGTLVSTLVGTLGVGEVQAAPECPTVIDEG